MQKSIRQLAEETGFDRQTVTNRLRRAKLKPTKSGRAHLYDTREALPAIYCPVDDASLDLTAERARPAHWQSIRAELDAKARQGELVPAKDVEATGATSSVARAPSCSTCRRSSRPWSWPAGTAGRSRKRPGRIVYEALTELGGGA
ncbi:MAG: DUF1441 family protein [Gammaproteobacteria bacterium]|nr:DUF1441 family protein [Gammaproteobacteria bacterium]